MVPDALGTFKDLVQARLVTTRMGRECFGLADGIVGGHVRDHGLMYAGAIAFFLLLSLIPLVLLFASVAGFLLSFLSVDAAPNSSDAVVRELVSYIRGIIPYLSQSFEADLARLLNTRSELGAVSGLALLIAASQVFRAIEFSFARILTHFQMS